MSKGTKKAVRTFNKWVGHAEIMYNPADDKVWTDVFTSTGEFKIYHSHLINCLVSKGTMQMSDNRDKTSVKKVESIINDRFVIREE